MLRSLFLILFHHVDPHAKVHATTKPEDKQLLSKLRKLISTNEKIKKAEAEFRLSCKEELAVMEEKNTSIRRKLEEIAALDGKSPEGARRCCGSHWLLRN